MDKAQLKARVAALLDGANSSNQVVQYLVGEMQKAQLEYEEVVAELGTVETKRGILRTRLSELQGIFAKYAEDIEHWDKAKTIRSTVPSDLEEL